MVKLRRILGDIEAEECRNLMQCMETQSALTLQTWAISYARLHYLPIYLAHGNNQNVVNLVAQCQSYLDGEITKNECKSTLKELRQLASYESDVIAIAAIRAIATACSTLTTITNALGFLFYGAAAYAYEQIGTSAEQAQYDALAKMELQSAYTSLKQASLENEKNPAVFHWHC